jgi:hypothetical protein
MGRILAQKNGHRRSPATTPEHREGGHVNRARYAANSPTLAELRDTEHLTAMNVGKAVELINRLQGASGGGRSS